MMLSCYCAGSLPHLCSLCVLPRDARTTTNNMAPDSQSEARAPGWKVMGLLVASWIDFLKHRQFVPVGGKRSVYRELCVCFFCSDGSIPSSAVSSAGPSSPITESSGLNFSFSE